MTSLQKSQSKKYAIFDIETDSPINLPRFGPTEYSRHPDFRVLCGVIKCSDSKEFEVFNKDSKTNYTKLRIRLVELYEKGYYLTAHNASFERACLRLARFPLVCTAQLSRVLGGPSSLADCSRLWLRQDLKNSEGWKLGKLCVGDYLESKAFKELVSYNIDDVKITEKLLNRLRVILGDDDVLGT